METCLIVFIACLGGLIIIFNVLMLLFSCLRKKETVTNRPAEKPNNHRSRDVTSNDGGGFMLYTAAASVPTVSDTGCHGNNHGGGGHSGGGGCGGGGGGGGCGGGGCD